MEDAFDRIGCSPEHVAAYTASAAMDRPVGPGWKSTILPRPGVSDMVDVFIPDHDERGAYVLVCDGHLYLQADTEEAAFANWPYECVAIVTGKPPEVVS